jgi:hypothetical protein
MNCPWKLRFSINEDEKLAWSAIEGDEEDALEVLSGTVEITEKDTQRDTLSFDDVDPYAYEFIETMFPHDCENIIQLNSEKNLFLVGEKFYDFDDMVTDKKFIHFEFKC